MIHWIGKKRANGPEASPAAQAGVLDLDDVPIEIDFRRIINQVPVTWHPQYGIHIGLSMGTLLLVMGILGAMAFVTQLGLLFWGVSLALAVFFISMVYPGWVLRSLKISRIIPDTGIVSQPLPITYTVTNTRRYFYAYSIRLVELFHEGQVGALPRIYIPHIAPGKSVSFQILVTPQKRGQLTCLGTRMASKYPFGLLTRFTTLICQCPVVIYPALGALTTHMVPSSRQHDFHMGLTQPRYRGTSDEFYALREYRPGDNPRLIHWKRSARLGSLIVREMSQYSPNRLTVILDTYLPAKDPHQLFLFEQMVSFGATVLCHTLEKGYRAGLVCSGAPPMMVPPLAGREAQHRMLRTLSSVEPQFGSSLADLFNNWRFTGSWSGRCFIVTMSDIPSNLVSKLSEIIGPVQVYMIGTADWRNTFVAPECLRKEVEACNV
jgi:uncharacterized protein (DUF58 family)